MFKIKNYILTPSDIYKGALHLVERVGLKDIIGLVVLLGLFFVFQNYFEWQADSSLFMIFWIALFFWNLDSRISIAGALVCLVFCPILLILENNYGFVMGEIWAEQSAVWAYYFLVIGVTKQIWEFRKENAEEKEELETDEETAEDVQLELEQIPSPVVRKTGSEKTKTVDEIIEGIQCVSRQADERIRQKNNITKQRRTMDIIPPTKVRK